MVLSLTDPNCLSLVAWPISSCKEAVDFRKTATRIINGLKGFVYEKSSSNVVTKLNSSFLAKAGGPEFVFFMFQFTLFINCGELKKKSMNEMIINEMISRTDDSLKSTAESSKKYKQVIQDSPKHIKNLESKLLNIEPREAIENKIAELTAKCNDSYDNFEQTKLVVAQCAKLADMIFKTPENCNANEIDITYSDQDGVIRISGKVDLVKLLTVIKSTLEDRISWCEQLNDEQTINDSSILEVQKSVMDMSEMVQCYETLIQQQQNSAIENLEIENRKLDEEVFTKKSYGNMVDLRIRRVYDKVPPVEIKLYLQSVQSTSVHCSSTPYTCQKLSLDDIRNIYMATLPNQIKIEEIFEDDEHSTALNESNETNNVTVHDSNDHVKSLVDKTTNDTLKNQQDQTDVSIIDSVNQNREDEIIRVRISRRSIENIKQKFNRIKKQGQEMRTILHSP